MLAAGVSSSTSWWPREAPSCSSSCAHTERMRRAHQPAIGEWIKVLFAGVDWMSLPLKRLVYTNRRCEFSEAGAQRDHADRAWLPQGVGAFMAAEAEHAAVRSVARVDETLAVGCVMKSRSRFR